MEENILGLSMEKSKNLLLENENSLVNLMNIEINKIRQETSNVRKGLFSRHSDMVKHFIKMYVLMTDIEKRVSYLEKKDV